VSFIYFLPNRVAKITSIIACRYALGTGAGSLVHRDAVQHGLKPMFLLEKKSALDFPLVKESGRA